MPNFHSYMKNSKNYSFICPSIYVAYYQAIPDSCQSSSFFWKVLLHKGNTVSCVFDTCDALMIAILRIYVMCI
jgi:hypothetical protein